MCCLLGTETSTNLHQKLYFHVLGTPQSEDVLCAEFPDHPKWMSGAEVREEDQLTDVRVHVLIGLQGGLESLHVCCRCQMMDATCCCLSGRVVIQSTDCGIVTFRPLLRVLQVCDTCLFGFIFYIHTPAAPFYLYYPRSVPIVSHIAVRSKKQVPVFYAPNLSEMKHVQCFHMLQESSLV